MNVKIVNKSNNKLPEYETVNSAGVDLRVELCNEDNLISFQDGTKGLELHPGKRHLFHTGLYIALPEGYEAQIRPRSGFALKHGITVLNTPGTIDSDYRGEICVILINHGEYPFIIRDGDRIAQMVFNKYERAYFEVVDSLDETERGDGGFGHTGTK